VIPKENAEPIFDISLLVSDCHESIESMRTHSYVETVFGILAKLNNHVNETKIWEKDCSETKRHIVLKSLLEGIYICCHFLYPIVPYAAKIVICNYMNANLKSYGELTWNNLQSGSVIQKQNTILFQMLDQSAYAIRAEKAKAKSTAKCTKKKCVENTKII
jgi:methionyl-tRNA synthetase